MLTETYHSFKIIPTDGRPHRDDVAPSYRGDSVGHWEGDTLVVDTTNFTDANWMHAEGLVSFHSDALHIVERYRRVDANTIEVEATVEDPKVLTGPWIVPKQTHAARALRSDHGSGLLGRRDGGSDGSRVEGELRQEVTRSLASGTAVAETIAASCR